MTLNTSIIEDNIKHASRRMIPWLKRGLFEGECAIIGGSPSLHNYIDEIKSLPPETMIFSLNGSHDWLISNGIIPDFYVQLDGRPCNDFVSDPQDTCIYLLASQANKGIFDKLKDSKVALWHADYEGFPHKYVNMRAKRMDMDSFDYIASKGTVGITTIALAYSMGFTKYHLYGMDSCHSAQHHAYDQEQNDSDKIVTHEINGEEFLTTPALLNQVWNFLHISKLLEYKGCEIVMRSEGLLKAVYEQSKNITPEESEKLKYEKIWGFDDYRTYSPGQHKAKEALLLLCPDDSMSFIDFGTGSGKGAAELEKAGHDVHAIDIAHNCQDKDNKHIPLLVACLWEDYDLKAEYGYCTDVMEHIPTDKVDAVLKNISKSIKKIYFQIDMIDDSFGAVIGDVLHLTVKDKDWWTDRLSQYFNITYSKISGHSLITVCEVKDELEERS